MLRTATKPKLSLSVPTLSISTNVPSAIPLSAVSRSPRSPLVSATTPLTQAARNTQLNARGLSTLQVPTFAYTNSASSKSILKRDASKQARESKSLRFNEEPSVQTVSPLPAECYGGLVMSKEERRWRSRD